ncbi:endophilin-B2 isoform X2 [Gadus morhua]|uniref:endophilin-B2 isoform X2 n=1 Tax=Gadus morhua TaxID=8049 RepID=UPI0011B4B792|nr:endophilin-B2-like isoform X2 [Gadus morhua]
MDFNMKKLASGAGVFFTRAVQFTEERLGQAERTEPDADLERLAGRADVTRLWTERICRQTEVLLRPNPGVRMEEFLYEKLDRTAPQRPASGQLLGRHMEDAARSLGPELAYGRGLLLVGACEQRLGRAEREFSQVSAVALIGPLRDFLEGDWSLITKERRLLENRRLDLDACKARLRRAQAAESKAATQPDFQETRPRNYVLSASASGLWTQEVEKASGLQAGDELQRAQAEFDQQAEVTKLLLGDISSTHVNHLRCLHEFVEAQAAYYKQCHLHMEDLQKELACGSAGGSGQQGEQSGGGGDPPSPPPGSRRARVLFDYDAADASELSLYADQLITVYTVPGMDSDWLIGERENHRGRVPVTYLELLS